MPGHVGPCSGNRGDGITNDAPPATVPVTADVNGNLEASRITDNGSAINAGSATDNLQLTHGYVQLYSQGGESYIGGDSSSVDIDDGGGVVSVSAGAGGIQLNALELTLGAVTSNARVSLSDAGKTVSVIADPTTGQINLNAGRMGFYDKTNVARPQVPAVATPQDIIDALKLLGLITQAS